MENYDLCVLGGGPSGYAAAMRAVDFGKKVILVERSRLGGAGVYNGALSSKTFWELSKEIASMRHKLDSYGMKMPQIPFGNILEEVDNAVYERSAQLEEHLRQIVHRDGENFRFVKGSGRLLTPNKIEMRGEFEPYVVRSDYTIIATGSRPRMLPNVDVDERIIMTSDGMSGLRSFPKSLIIVGAGVIGCEFASIFSNFGNTDVRLIARDDRILPFEDEDLTKIIERNLEKSGVTIHRQSSLLS
ncbi:MAG: FAD-dependent oxidoreductase, partial [Deltaproteobacteria bacterium]